MAKAKQSKRSADRARRAIFMPSWQQQPPQKVVIKHPMADEIEAFLVETGMSPTFFGYGVMRDPAFVFEVRRGRDLRGTTENKVRVQMAFYRQCRQFLDP